jgi:hypothetical protein
VNVPVLARWIEEAGIPTVLVTMMPDVAERIGAPRIVGVEFPFGHPFGLRGDRALQRRVLGTALTVLAGATAPGARIDIDVEWPVPRGQAYRDWQPSEASPIVAMMLAEREAAANADDA